MNRKIRIIICFITGIIFLAGCQKKEEVSEQPFDWITEEKTFWEVKAMYEWDIADEATGELSLLTPKVDLDGVKGNLYTIDNEADGIVNTIQWYRTYLNDQGEPYEEIDKDEYKEQLALWYNKVENDLKEIYGEPDQEEDFGENNQTSFWQVKKENGVLQIAIYAIGTNAGYSKTFFQQD